MAARLLEPSFWAVAFWILSRRMDDLEALLPAAALYLVARLASDTAPNLVVARRLEQSPFDERRIRRALMVVKFILAMASAIVVHAAVAMFLRRAPAETSAIVAGLGGRTAVLAGTFVVLASHAIAIPAVRSHRGIPTARPNAGPASGAFLFACAAGFVPAEPHHVLRLGAACILAGTVIIGALQRYRAAVRRMNHPQHGLFDADVRAEPGAGPEEASRMLGESLRAIPLVLLPVVPACAAAWSTQGVGALAAFCAAGAAALPPMLFDARRGERRFRWTSLLLGIVATVIAAAASAPLAATDSGDVLQRAGLLLFAYPACTSLLRLRAGAQLLALVAAYECTTFAIVLAARDPVPRLEWAFLATAWAAWCMIAWRRRAR